MTNITDITDFFGIYTYTDDLIYFGVENFESWVHREAAVKKGFLLKPYICKLDEEIFSERPITVPDIFGGQEQKQEGEKPDVVNGNKMELITINSEEKSSEINSVLEDWTNEKWNALFIKMMNKARTHTFCVVVLYDAPPWWRVFSFRQIEKITYNEHDLPISISVRWARKLPLSENYSEYAEEITLINEYDEETGKLKSRGLFVPFCAPDGGNLGEYDFEHMWSLDVYLRYILLDIVNNSAKTSGFYWTTYGSAITDTQKQDYINKMDYVGSCRGVGAKKEVIEEITAMYPAKPEFSVIALDKVLRLFAGAARLPLAFFNAEMESAGVLGGPNYADEMKVNKKKRFIFDQFKNAMMKLIELRWGIKLEDIFPNIEEMEDETYKEEIVEPEEKNEKETEKAPINER